MGISDAYYVDTLRHYYGICKYFLHIKSSSYTKRLQIEMDRVDS